MAHRKESVVLLIHCKDRRGIVARVSASFTTSAGTFSIRIIIQMKRRTSFSCAWSLPPKVCKFRPMKSQPPLLRSQRPSRCAIRFALQVAERGSRCWSRNRIIVWRICSNGTNATSCTSISRDYFQSRYLCRLGRAVQDSLLLLSRDQETKPQQEQQVLSLLKDHSVELVVMARYMQILSASFLSQVGCPVINIHHSFLPAFIALIPIGRPMTGV